VGIKEHETYIHNEHIHIPTLVEHSLKKKHHICLRSVEVIAKEEHCIIWCFKQALEIDEHEKNMNKDGGL